MLCFGKFAVATKFVDKKDGGEYQNFLPKTFCLTLPKNFVRKPSRVSLISGIENYYAQKEYVTIFRRIFLSRGAKKHCRRTLLSCVPESFR